MNGRKVAVVALCSLQILSSAVFGVTTHPSPVHNVRCASAAKMSVVPLAWFV